MPPHILYLASDCQQSCAFCAVKASYPPADRGEVDLVRLLAEARVAREAGAERIQLDGLDPASFSQILPLVGGIQTLGFQHLTVMGTGRRFAEADFRRELFRLAPASTVVVVPLYGVTAEVHESVTGRAGSFVSATQAIDGLIRDRGRSAVEITTVPVPRNVHQIAAVITYGVSRGVQVRGRLPYVLRDVGDAAYASVAMRESDIVAAFGRSIPDVPWRYRRKVARTFRAMMPHPCLLRREGGRLRPHRRDYFALEGATDGFVDLVPCPHVSKCSLSSRCPGVLYAEYAAKFGTGELG